MKKKRSFKVPNDSEVMVQLVEAIPITWSRVDGVIYAPKSLVSSGQAEKNTGYCLDWSKGTVIIGRTRRGGVRITPNVPAIIIEQKLPGFISFVEAGYQPAVSLEFAIEVAAHFLRKGFRGDLHFCSEHVNNRRFDNPACCTFIFSTSPPLVRLTWDEKRGDSEEDVSSVVSTCLSLGLEVSTD